MTTHDGRSEQMARTFIVLSLLALGGGCSSLNKGPMSEPAPTAPITIGQVPEQVDLGFPSSPRQSLAERCRDTQSKRLEACENQRCREEVQHKLALCEQLSNDADDPQAVLGVLSPCKGIEPVQQCSVASPCVLGGDRNGDGVVDRCVAGARCAPASEGSMCDTGLIYNCFLVTTFYPAGPIRPLDQCECNCE